MCAGRATGGAGCAVESALAVRQRVRDVWQEVYQVCGQKCRVRRARGVSARSDRYGISIFRSRLCIDMQGKLVGVSECFENM